MSKSIIIIFSLLIFDLVYCQEEPTIASLSEKITLIQWAVLSQIVVALANITYVIQRDFKCNSKCSDCCDMSLDYEVKKEQTPNNKMDQV